MEKITLIGFLITFSLGTCTGQSKEYQSITDWWNEYKSKSDRTYDYITSMAVDRWDTIRQAKKAGALAHLNSLQSIDDSCERSINSRGSGIACALDQEQRHCEFGWTYNPLGTKKQICILLNSPHRGNCCTIQFTGSSASSTRSGQGGAIVAPPAPSARPTTPIVPPPNAMAPPPSAVTPPPGAVTPPLGTVTPPPNTVTPLTLPKMVPPQPSGAIAPLPPYADNH